MTGLFMKTIVLSAINGKSNPTKNQYRPKDLSSFDGVTSYQLLNIKFEYIESFLIVFFYNQDTI